MTPCMDMTETITSTEVRETTERSAEQVTTNCTEKVVTMTLSEEEATTKWTAEKVTTSF